MHEVSEVGGSRVNLTTLMHPLHQVAARKKCHSRDAEISDAPFFATGATNFKLNQSFDWLVMDILDFGQGLRMNEWTISRVE